MSIGAATINAEAMGKARADVTFERADMPVYAVEESMSTKVRHATVGHWHEGVELIHVLSGGMRCRINDVDLDLRPGDFCFINRRQIHLADSGNHGDFRANVLIVDPTLLTRSDAVVSRFINPLLDNEDLPYFHLSGKDGTAADLGNFIDEIAQLQKTKPEAYELTMIGLLHLIFQRIYLAYTAGKCSCEPVDQDAQAQRRMASYIYEHFDEKVTLDDIAAAGSVSRSKCAKVFKQFVQKSPIDFLNLYRLEVASRLLRNTDESISRIALSCGFSQQSYFNRMFGRTYGCTPREYREHFASAS